MTTSNTNEPQHAAARGRGGRGFGRRGGRLHSLSYRRIPDESTISNIASTSNSQDVVVTVSEPSLVNSTSTEEAKAPSTSTDAWVAGGRGRGNGRGAYRGGRGFHPRGRGQFESNKKWVREKTVQEALDLSLRSERT